MALRYKAPNVPKDQVTFTSPMNTRRAMIIPTAITAKSGVVPALFNLVKKLGISPRRAIANSKRDTPKTVVNKILSIEVTAPTAKKLETKGIPKLSATAFKGAAFNLVASANASEPIDPKLMTATQI